MHPYWFTSQKYFFTSVVDQEKLNEDMILSWWANESFFEIYKEWLYEEYQATPGTMYTFKYDNPDIKDNLEEWIEFKDSRQAELFVLKFSK